MSKYKFLYIVACLLFLIALNETLASCKNHRPKGVLSASKMEKILYDYHIAEALGQSSKDSAGYYTLLYTDAVLAKYDVSRKDFDNSMLYYSRHTGELYKIYQQINSRFGSQENPEQMRKDNLPMSLTGDTALIWKGNAVTILSSNAENRLSFKVIPDSDLKSGDRVVFQYSSNWIYKEGNRSAVADLAIYYANDSVANISQTFYNGGLQQLTLYAGKERIKKIQGFIYQDAPWSKSPKLLIIYNPALIKYHEKPLSAPNVQEDRGENDSVMQQERDVNKDSLERERAPQSSIQVIN